MKTSACRTGVLEADAPQKSRGNPDGCRSRPGRSPWSQMMPVERFRRPNSRDGATSTVRLGPRDRRRPRSLHLPHVIAAGKVDVATIHDRWLRLPARAYRAHERRAACACRDVDKTRNVAPQVEQRRASSPPPWWCGSAPSRKDRQAQSDGRSSPGRRRYWSGQPQFFVDVQRILAWVMSRCRPTPHGYASRAFRWHRPSVERRRLGSPCDRVSMRGPPRPGLDVAQAFPVGQLGDRPSTGIGAWEATPGDAARVDDPREMESDGEVHELSEPGVLPVFKHLPIGETPKSAPSNHTPCCSLQTTWLSSRHRSNRTAVTIIIIDSSRGASTGRIIKGTGVGWRPTPWAAAWPESWPRCRAGRRSC